MFVVACWKFPQERLCSMKVEGFVIMPYSSKSILQLQFWIFLSSHSTCANLIANNFWHEFIVNCMIKHCHITKSWPKSNLDQTSAAISWPILILVRTTTSSNDILRYDSNEIYRWELLNYWRSSFVTLIYYQNLWKWKLIPTNLGRLKINHKTIAKPTNLHVLSADGNWWSHNVV